MQTLPTFFLRRGGRVLQYLACVLVLWGCSGCNSDKSTSASNSKKGTNDDVPATADGVFEQMVKTYQAAKKYQDEAVVLFQTKRAEGANTDSIKVHIAFERPNRLRFERDDGVVVSDGEKAYGKPDGFSDQVVVTKAPETLVVPDFYKNEFLAPLMQPDICNYLVQLNLLTAAEPLADSRGTGVEWRMLDPATIEDHNCHRIQQDVPDGKLTFWIDQQSHLLRRVEYPTNELKKQMLAQGFEDVTVTVEFVAAQIDQGDLSDQFAWTETKEENYVRYLSYPPHPMLKPHQLLGKEVPELSITNPDGSEFDAQSLDGKITVIDLWATWCQPCIEAMPKTDEIRKKYEDNDQVQVLAVSLDDASVENDKIAEKLQEIAAGMPWARGPFETIRERLNLDAIPAYMVLGKERRIHFLNFGSAEVEKSIQAAVEQLLEGKDPSAEAAREWEKLQESYQEQIQLAGLENLSVDIENPLAGIAEFSQPKLFTVTERWKTTKVKVPGNLAAIHSPDGAPEFYAISDFRSVVQLDDSGEIKAAHDDILPGDAVITFIRTTANKEGRPLFVVGAVMHSQFFVFDENWEQLLQHPEGGTAEVYDVMPADLDGDGSIEFCVGYFNEAGVHCVSLEGNRLWRNRSIARVTDLAVAGPGEDGHRRLLCVHEQSTLATIDSQGKELPQVRLPNQALANVASANLDDDPENEIVGITDDGRGSRVTVGLGDDGRVIWRHGLPRGVHRGPIDGLLAMRPSPDEPGWWLIANADGSVLFVSADGEQTDKFNTGQQLTGIATLRIGEEQVLVVASNEAVTAYTVAKK